MSSSIPMLKRCFERQYDGLDDYDKEWLETFGPTFVSNETQIEEYVIWWTKTDNWQTDMRLMSVKLEVDK